MNESLPPLVRRAMLAAREMGFPASTDEANAHGGTGPSCSLADAGRVLAMLAASCHNGRIGEMGTGTGFGSAWLATGMPASAKLVTVELDLARSRAAAEVFLDEPRVGVIHGDANEIIPQYAPFDLLFCDGTWRGGSELAGMLKVGGRLVVDDVTPRALLSPDSPFSTDDPKRRVFFDDERMVSVEIVLPDLRHAVLVGTRIR